MPAAPLILNGPDADTSDYIWRDRPPLVRPLQPTATDGQNGPSGPGGQDPRAQFAAEWDSAQQRYRAAMNAGYSAEDAAQMYLQPVQNKWDILKDVPAEQRQSAARDLDQAQQSFLTGIRSGYQPEDAANLYLKPSQQKWVAAAGVPESPTATAKQAQTQFELVDQARQGKNNQGELESQVPVTFWNNPKFVAAFQTATQRAQADKARRDAIAAKTSAPYTPAQAATSLNKIISLEKARRSFGGSPTDLANSNLVQQAESALQREYNQRAPVTFQPTPNTNAVPPPEPPPATTVLPSASWFTPHATRFTLSTPGQQADFGIQTPPAPPATQKVSANQPPKTATREGARDLATQISAEHPDWTKDQVILAVQGKLLGAK